MEGLGGCSVSVSEFMYDERSSGSFLCWAALSILSDASRASSISCASFAFFASAARTGNVFAGSSTIEGGSGGSSEGRSFDIGFDERGD